MSRIYTEFLDSERKKIWRQDLPRIAGDGVLGGGTALAFQLRHRISYDFDVFYQKAVSPQLLVSVNKHFGQQNIDLLVNTGDELSVLVKKEVKLTFLYFPFPPLHESVKTASLPLFDLRDLASNKAYALGRRPAYRDYVDLFFILKKGLKLATIIKEAEKRFGGNFSEKLFLEQLTYFEDLQAGKIEFLRKPHSQQEIEGFLEEKVKKYSALKNM